MPTLQDLQNQRQNYFKQRRDQTIGQSNANLQQNTDAIQRRFTAMGAANSGAALQADQNARNQNEIEQRQALNDLSGQEMQAGEGDLARQFQTQEAERARQFQGSESQAGRQFQGGLAGQDLAFKQKLADTEQQNKLAQMDMARQQFELDKDTAAFNKRMAEIAVNAPQDPGLLGGILGGRLTPQEMVRRMYDPLGLIGRSDRGGLGVSIGDFSF